MKAYLISRENGVVQIGHLVYVLPLKVAFSADRRGLVKRPYCEVKRNSWADAEEAYHRIVEALSDPSKGSNVFIPVKART